MCLTAACWTPWPAYTAKISKLPLAYRSMAFVDMEIPAGRPGEPCASANACWPHVLKTLAAGPVNLQKQSACWKSAQARLWRPCQQHADQVVSFEIDPVLASVARENLERAGIRASVRVATVRAAPSPTDPSMPSC